MRTSEKLKGIPERLRDRDLTNENHDAIVQWIDRDVRSLLWTVCGDQIEAEARQRDPNKRPLEIGLKIKTKTWEYAITKGGPYHGTEKSVIGFVDLRVEFEYSHRYADWWYRHYPISFEAKTYIKSCGELIRQIRLYQTYVHDHFVVVSPDLRFAEQLQSQGISFIAYPGETEVVA
jgi:hypothetical protein